MKVFNHRDGPSLDEMRIKTLADMLDPEHEGPCIVTLYEFSKWWTELCWEEIILPRLEVIFSEDKEE